MVYIQRKDGKYLETVDEFDTLKDRAIELIEAMASNRGDADLVAIRDALEDGDALASLGYTDDDQALVEEAHEIVSEWLTGNNAHEVVEYI